ncbi:MAG: bifunctional diaminohydroxyphosphoribosylaminopyrimidine deaminase/5-amino-6-(5-phosphoribosylamino)uracil reductase RibD [Endomicrobiia bacterium]
MNKSDEKYLNLCLKLAKKGERKTFPNPMVGCVIVKNDKIIGKGYHKAFGMPHAEIEAINSVKNKQELRDSTLYVNLEPCSHWGKTPPCVDSIIKSGIKRVVCATLDPNPLVNGNGIKKLEVNGVKCEVGILEKKSLKLNKKYFNWLKNRPLPRFTIKSAITLDGKIATYTGNAKWISSEKSRKYSYKLRTKYNAIMVGINTVLNDNPALTSHNYGKNPVRIILGNINRIKNPRKYKVFTDGLPTIFVTYKTPKNKVLLEKYKNVKILEITANKKNKCVNKIDLKQVFLNPLFSSITSVLVEGGGETVWNVIESGIATDFILFVAPKIFGGSGAKTFVEGCGVRNPQEAINVKFDKIERVGTDLIIKGKFLSS